MRVFATEDWAGPHKIVVGIDIGATQSAVAFTYLAPGKPQTLYRVQEWPGQPAHKGQSRIPSQIYYDKECKPMYCGAEANEPPEEDEGMLVRHFKFHLHPTALRRRQDITLEALPEGITLPRIYTDFMAYLFAHTKKYFCEHILNGGKIWEEYHDDITIVLSHPNGWGTKEQGFLRRAAIAAKLVRSGNAHSNVQFVSEAEASVHFCMYHADLHRSMNKGVHFVKYLSPIVNQLDAPQETLQDYMQRGIREFEENVKKEFNGTGVHRINLGARRKSSYEHLGIKHGKLILNNDTIKSFFNESVETAIECIRDQMESGCQHILLVGGFGDSPYLRRIINSEFAAAGCPVTVTNDPNAKAVADGSVLWCAKRSVVARATRMAYGIQVVTPYDRNNAEHCGRRTVVECDGVEKVVGLWSQIVGQGTVMDAKDAVREGYMRFYDNPKADLGHFSVAIYAYTGAGKNLNTWVVNKNGQREQGFEEVCQIEADLSGMRKALKNNAQRLKRAGDWFHSTKFYRLDFKVGIQFGDTEIKAFLEWEQDVSA
ncbi:hypothetical protein OPQ81_002630 [Rhizoctonia solani]|nr:hypothetical protein OPQ81_002630 [Rhizoctonia solani]